MLKNFLLITLILVLFGGVTFFFIKSRNLSMPTTSTSTLTTPTSISASPSPEQSIILDDSVKCDTSDQCIILSEPVVSSTSAAKNINIKCANKSYLSTCKNCKVDSELITETKKEVSCACIKNVCQFQQ